MTYTDLDEAIEMHNAVPQGLSSSIFTSDLRVQTLCYSLLPAFVLYQFGDCTQIIFSNSLRALEAVGRMLLYAIIAYLLVSIPMSYLHGILLAFGMTFPNERLFIIPIPFPIKAKYFVMFYAFIEILQGFGSHDGVAHFAHLGGMLFGLLLILYWRKQVRRQQFSNNFWI